MSATNALESAILSLIFANDNFSNVGDATGLQGSVTPGSFYISLHTADPGETGTQSTSEANYTSYGRVAIVRSSSGWTISGSTASNTSSVAFPGATGGSSVITHFGIGTDETGAGNLLFTGALTSSLSVSNGITPNFAIGALTVTAD